MRRKVGILVFPEVEVLDFCGPFEVFSVTRLDEDRRRRTPSPYEVLDHHRESGRRCRHWRSENRSRSPFVRTARRLTCWWFQAAGEPAGRCTTIG